MPQGIVRSAALGLQLKVVDESLAHLADVLRRQGPFNAAGTIPMLRGGFA